MGAKLAYIAAALLPIGTLGGQEIRGWISRHPVLAVAVIIAYEAVIALIAILRRMLQGTLRRWEDTATEALDAWTIRTFTTFERRYISYVRRAHQTLRTVGVVTRGIYALPLDEIYISLRLLSTAPHAVERGVVPDTFGADKVPKSQGGLSIWELLAPQTRQPETRLAILGRPGSGKSTLLEYCALILSSSRKVKRSIGAPLNLIPAFLPLRKLAEQLDLKLDITLSAAIQLALPDPYHGPAGWFEARLRRGRVALLVDGLDEVGEPERRRLVVEWLDKQMSQYPDCYYVVTSRPHGYEENPLETATIVQVQRLTDLEVENFVKRWYLAVEERTVGRMDDIVRAEAVRGSNEFLADLSRIPGLRDLTANPLLLTMATNVHYYRGHLPASRTDLYSEICDVVSGRRDTAKGVATSLTTAQKLSILQTLALVMMERRSRSLSAIEIYPIIERAAESMDTDIAVTDLLHLLQNNTGLLVELEAERWAFSHLTFQEYLAAMQLIETSRDVPSWDPWWFEVIAFWSSRVDPSNKVGDLLSDQNNLQWLGGISICVDHAKSLRRDVRSNYDEVIAAKFAELSITAFQVVTERLWRNRTRLAADAEIRSIPLTLAEYSFFCEWEIRRGGQIRMQDHVVAAGTNTSDLTNWRSIKPALGLRRQDVEAFMAWMHETIPGTLSIRLATNEECAAGYPNMGLGFWTSDRGFKNATMPSAEIELLVGIHSSKILKFYVYDLTQLWEQEQLNGSPLSTLRDIASADFIEAMLKAVSTAGFHTAAEVSGSGGAALNWGSVPIELVYGVSDRFVHTSISPFRLILREIFEVLSTGANGSLTAVDIGMYQQDFERTASTVGVGWEMSSHPERRRFSDILSMTRWALSRLVERHAVISDPATAADNRQLARSGLWLLLSYLASLHVECSSFDKLFDHPSGKQDFSDLYTVGLHALWALLHLESRVESDTLPWETAAFARAMD